MAVPFLWYPGVSTVKVWIVWGDADWANELVTNKNSLFRLRRCPGGSSTPSRSDFETNWNTHTHARPLRRNKSPGRMEHATCAECTPADSTDASTPTTSPTPPNPPTPTRRHPWGPTPANYRHSAPFASNLLTIIAKTIHCLSIYKTSSH